MGPHSGMSAASVVKIANVVPKEGYLPETQEEIDESVVNMGKMVPHIDQDFEQLLDSLKESLVGERRHAKYPC